MPLLKRLLAFSALLLLLSAQFARAEDVKLMQTGQVIPSTEPAETTDDGALQMGLHWTASTRFVTNPDGTITDNMTGLMWMPYGDLPERTGYSKATASGTVNWVNALDLINQINSGSLAQFNMGYADWRLPNIIELESITSAGTECAGMLNNNGFIGVYPEAYASSNTFAGSSSNTYYMLMLCGKTVKTGKSQGMRVMAVRGDANGQGAIWKTGQTVSYRAGDDGATEKGVKWPDPRFVSLGDGTVADRLTNLIWLQDAGTPAYGAYKSRNTKTWTEALDYVAQMNQGNYLRHTDSRLPNRREMESLADFSQYKPALTPGNRFSNVRFGTNTSIGYRSPNFYWTSTSHYIHKDQAFWTDLYDGGVGFAHKQDWADSQGGSHLAPKYFVWPVCGDTAVQLQIPASKITSPHNGDYMPGPLGAYSITGKADEIGGAISGVSVSSDGGKTWDAATDTSGDGSWSTWQYTWKPSAPGSYTIQSKASDSNGKEEYPGPGIKVSAGIYKLTVTPSANGTVTLSPAGGTYNDGTKVTVTANPASGYAFAGWTGALSGTTNPAVVTMDSDKSVGATFTRKLGLTVNSSPSDGGTVQVSPAGPYNPGDVVSLKAVPAAGYVFAGWVGDVASKTSASTSITMDGDKAVTALFSKTLAFSFTQYGRWVTMNATFSGTNPSGRTVNFALSEDGGKTWVLIASAATNKDGACSATRIFDINAYKLRAACRTADGQVYRSTVLDCNIAQVKTLSPANGALVNTPAPTVSWAAMPGATGYVVNTFVGGALLAQKTVAGGATSAALSTLPRGQKASWSINALIPSGKCVVSATREITYREVTSLAVDPKLSGKTITPAATLTGNDSGPIAKKTITFTLINPAGRTINLGQAVTDQTGTAHPAPRLLGRVGKFTIKAAFGGGPALTAVTAQSDFTVQ